MSISMQQKFERMKQLHAEEQNRQSVARTVTDIPFSFELISDDWLTNTVCRGTPRAQVTAHSLDQADEGTSNRRRIFLNYNEDGRKAGLPASVFCKATQSLESRFILGLNDVAEAEVVFYNHVRPLLDIEAPVGIFANFNPESLNSIVILEDMRGRAEFCDDRTEISLARAESQMRLLARLHGKFQDNPALRPVLERFQTFVEFYDKTEAAVGWTACQRRGLQTARHLLPPRLESRIEDIAPFTEQAFRSHAKLPVTLLHSDVHLKNWYVAANGEMGLMDWQVLTRGNGIRDLAYAISTAMTTENRRAWEMHLIRYYLEQLKDAGGTGPSFDETLTLYRQQLFCALAMWTTTLAPPEGAPVMQPPQTALRFIDRMAHAIDDLDSFGAMVL
jgi:thiamine kinase-like enzyme